MRRVGIVAAVLFVPLAAAAEPAGPTPPKEAPPVQVAAAPGETPVGGDPEADLAPVPPPPSSGGVLAPPGMIPVATPVDRPVKKPDAKIGLARRNDVDAASDRSYLLGSALTSGAGKVTATWRTVIGPSVGLAGISVGLTDRIELGAHIIYGGDDEDVESIKGGSMKFQLFREARTAIAVEANVLGTDGDEVVGMAVANMSTCLDRACGSIASVHGGVMLATEGDEVPLLGGVSMVVGSGSIKFVSELLSVEIDRERLIGGMFGMRFGGRQFAIDLGIAFAAADGGGGAIPVFGLSLRP